MKVKMSELVGDNNEALIMSTKIATFEASPFKLWFVSMFGRQWWIPDNGEYVVLFIYKRKLYYYGRMNIN